MARRKKQEIEPETAAIFEPITDTQQRFIEALLSIRRGKTRLPLGDGMKAPMKAGVGKAKS